MPVISRTIPDSVSETENPFNYYDTNREFLISFTGNSALKDYLEIEESP